MTQLAEFASAVLRSEPDSEEFAAASRSLAEAAFCDDLALAREATRVIFADIIEPWADSFLPAFVDHADRFMAEAVFATKSPIARGLDALGYASPEDLLGRIRRVCRDAPGHSDDPGLVRKVVVLSRVTLGADIAVTSPIIECVRRAFPEAQVDFIAPEKNAQLIADGRFVRPCHVQYKRSATLGQRLEAWYEVRASVRSCIHSLRPGQWLVVDPDSRLTQLGLLPVAEDSGYRFFESRRHGPGIDSPLRNLAVEWCDRLWGIGTEGLYTSARIGSEDRARGELLRARAGRPIVAVSLGVGGRPEKSLGPEFEDALLALLRRRGYHVVLDYGAGEDEFRNVNERLRAFPGTVTAWDRLDADAELPDLLTWKGSLPAFGGLVATADLHIGYDSAAAHLASALGVPGFVVFVGARSYLMRWRWTPSGSGEASVIPADGAGDGTAVLERIQSLLPPDGPADG